MCTCWPGLQHLIRGGSKPKGWKQMEDLREPLSQSMPEKPDTFSNARPVENVLRAVITADPTAEMMKSKTKHKLDEPDF